MRPKRKKAGAAVAQNVRPWLDSGWRDRDANWRSRTDGQETPKEPRANEREEKERDRRKGKRRKEKERKERKERKKRLGLRVAGCSSFASTRPGRVAKSRVDVCVCSVSL